jgi:hypothetical protein
MPEDLKKLSDRATPGEAYADMGDYRLIAHPPGSTYIPDRTVVALCACGGKAGANVRFLAALWTTYRRGELHDDTALATAVARARREALEEAKTACLDLSDAYRETGEHHMGVGPKGPDPVLTKAAEALAWARGATECAHALTKLAATPPEDRQTETGWKPPAGWKLVPEKLTHAMADDIFRTTWPVPTLERAQALWAAGLERAPPPPAIGNLEGEGRSHG